MDTLPDTRMVTMGDRMELVEAHVASQGQLIKALQLGQMSHARTLQAVHLDLQVRQLAAYGGPFKRLLRWFRRRAT